MRKYLLLACCICFLICCKYTKKRYVSAEPDDDRDTLSLTSTDDSLSYENLIDEEIKYPTDTISTEVAFDTNQRNLYIKAKKIEAYLCRLAENRSFNGSALVAVNGKVIYKDALGYSNFETNEGLHNSSAFHIASVSKQFTAVAIMILKERGKLDYDDPVVKYLPGLKFTTVTIRHLLNHTSGVPDVIRYVPTYYRYADSSENHVGTISELVDSMVSKRTSTSWIPGSRFFYSNANYILLAAIVEKVSGMSFEEFVKKNIFIPAGMKNSVVYNKAKNTKVSYRVYAFDGYRGRMDDDDPRNGLVGEKNVYTTAEDLYKWDQALYNGTLLKPETLSEAFRQGKLNNGKPVNYGFGWRISDVISGKKVVYHYGHWRSWKAGFIRVLSDNTAIILMTNTNRDIKPLINSIIDILYDRKPPPKKKPKRKKSKKRRR